MSWEGMSPGDVAIWWTVRINDLIDAGRFYEVPPVATTFAPADGVSERAVAQGPFEVYEYRASGDGSYVHDGGFFFASGAAGLALTAGVAAARVLGNSARKRAAVQAAQPCWQPSFCGHITVSQLAFYLQAPTGLLHWRWESIDSVELIGPHRLHMQGRSTTGPIAWIIHSDWSELILTLWCRFRHPQHPQFVGQVWIPQGWSHKLTRAGHQLPPSVSGRWQLDA